MDKRKPWPIILFLGSFSLLGPLAIDMYLPAFPALSRDLQAPIGAISYSISAFLFGVAAGQLCYGPMLDRFGRRKVLLGGLLLFALASLACTQAYSLQQLLFLRFLQALGSCAADLGATALTRDLFDKKERARAFTRVMLVVGISPLVGPTLGAYLVSSWGWESIFFILALTAMLLVPALLFGVPRMAAPKTDEISLRQYLKSYREVLSHPVFFTYGLTAGFTMAGLYAYYAGSPVVFLEGYGLSEKAFGWLIAFMSLAFIGLGQLNNWLLKFLSPAQIVFRAVVGQLIISIFFSFTLALGAVNLPLLILFLFAYLTGNGFVYPNTSALALGAFSVTSGSATALFGGLQLALGALASMAVSSLTSFLPMPAPMIVVMAACAVFSFLVLRYGQRYLAVTEPVELQPEELENA